MTKANSEVFIIQQEWLVHTCGNASLADLTTSRFVLFYQLFFSLTFLYFCDATWKSCSNKNANVIQKQWTLRVYTCMYESCDYKRQDVFRWDVLVMITQMFPFFFTKKQQTFNKKDLAKAWISTLRVFNNGNMESNESIQHITLW